MTPDTKVKLGALELATPVATASGTFGYGFEYLGAVDYTKLGAVTAKGLRLEPWPGNPMPRHAETPGADNTDSFHSNSIFFASATNDWE